MLAGNDSCTLKTLDKHYCIFRCEDHALRELFADLFLIAEDKNAYVHLCLGPIRWYELSIIESYSIFDLLYSRAPLRKGADNLR